MNESTSSLLLRRFSQLVAEQTGLCFPMERMSDLERGVKSAAAEFGFGDLDACIQWLMSAPLDREQVEILASNLTVGETYFFRERKTFDAIEEHALPQLIRRRRGQDQRLRLWSAACCTGEEPYSLAVSLRKTLPDLANWDARILGTDINPRFLRKAMSGTFSEWSFREMPATFKDHYFKKNRDGSREILPEIRQMVDFSYLNLAADIYPSLLNQTSSVDIIFCRNVLIYFTPEQVTRVLRNLAQCLTEGGWLIVGLTESSLAHGVGLVPVRFPGTVLFQKQMMKTVPAHRSHPAVIEEPTFFSEGNPPDLALNIPLEQAELNPVSAQFGFDKGLARQEQPQERERDLARAEPSHEGLAQGKREEHTMARTLANEGKLAEALDLCDRILSSDKMNPVGHYLRAGILQERGNMAEAVSAFKRVLYLDPDFVLAHFCLGNLARSQGKFFEAEKNFGNALALAQRLRAEELLPESDGLTAGRLCQIIVASRSVVAPS